MRIGVNCFMLRDDIGGMRQYFHRLFDELLLNHPEHTCVFFHFSHNVAELEHLGTDRWKRDAVLLGDQDEIGRHLDRLDVYFCPFGALWPRPVPLPSVVTVHDIQEKYHPEFFQKADLWNRRLYGDPSTHLADRVVTVSEFSKDSIVRMHRRPAEKVLVAYHCAPRVTEGERAAGAPAPRFALPDRYLLYPANHWLHKNHRNLLAALRLLREKHGLAVDCVFTGHDMPHGYSLAAGVEEHGLRDQAHLVGYVTQRELTSLYRGAEALCFPSLFEGFGMPVLEAMTHGCPVTCSGTTSLPEVGGDAALYFDPTRPEDVADKIKAVWTDPALRASLIARGYRQAAGFTAARMAEAHVRAFSQAASSYRLGKYVYDKTLYVPLYLAKILLGEGLRRIFRSGSSRRRGAEMDAVAAGDGESSHE